MNMNNFGIVEGRLTRDVVVLPNKDGSRKVFTSLASQNNYKNKATGNRDSQFIDLEGFISNTKTNNGVFEHMNKGDLVSIQYSVRTDNYVKKDGSMHYGQVLFIESVDLKETKKTVENRKLANANTQNIQPVQQNTQTQQPVPMQRQEVPAFALADNPFNV